MLTSKQIKSIDENYYYDRQDLGLEIKDNIFNFKIWSPLASKAILKIYDNYDSEDFVTYKMDKENGVFFVSVSDDIENKFYAFSLEIDGIINDLVDPYAKAISVNGLKGAVIDMKKTNPEGFEEETFNAEKDLPIICEMSIRDISIDESSKLKNKGKFLALTEKQNGDFEDLTGLNHIKEMGFTYVQIMPFYDFASIDEKLANNNEYLDNRSYNWGYDPQNYNALEGSYSTNPYNPISRIKEAKKMIQSIHNQGIGVIMDVVYNHLYEYEKSSFHCSMPGYFFRYKDGKLNDETGCGNVFASENKMARKFIVDSVRFLAKEYKLDGFRFDLMGLIDIETISEVRDELRKINPNILIIGEGWDMDSLLPREKKAIQKNAKNLRDVAFFNDSIRNALRGNDFDQKDRGYLCGDFTKKIEVQKSIVGGIDYSNEIRLWGKTFPNQVINYVECHDNCTFRDKLSAVIADEKDLVELQKLSLGIILLSQGIPFMQVGQEFLRTKSGVENSYKSPDSINKVDWNRKKKYIDVVSYVKGLIELRKSNNIFNLKNVDDIKNSIKFIETIDSCIAYTIECKGEKMLVIHNTSLKEYSIEFDQEIDVNILVNKFEVNKEGIKRFKTRKIVIDEVSSFVARVK